MHKTLARKTGHLPQAALEYLDIADGELMRIAHITRQTLGFYREFSAATSNSTTSLIDSVISLLRRRSGLTEPGLNSKEILCFG
jgi:two-component system, NtrC family, sensor kinase